MYIYRVSFCGFLLSRRLRSAEPKLTVKLCQNWQILPALGLKTDKSVIGSGFWISMNNSTCFPSTFTVQISEGLMKYYKHILRVNATDLTPLPITQTTVWPSVIVIFLRPHRERGLTVGGDLESPYPDLCCPSTLHWLQPGAEPG